MSWPGEPGSNRRARCRGPNQRDADAAPKTDSSVRTISIPAFVLEALETHRSRQRVVAISGLIFTTPTGAPLDPKRVHERLQELLKAAGLPPMRVHDLRHAAASAMYAAGVPIRAIAGTLGHSDVRMTLDTYAHGVPDLAAETARRMDAYVRRGTG